MAKATDKAEEYRLISKEHIWLSKHYRHLYEIEMMERGELPHTNDEAPNQLNLFNDEEQSHLQDHHS